jgi:oligopeptide transport system permease protein
MGKFVLRRLVQMLFVLLGATLILFVALFIVPGDPVGSLAGSDRTRDPAVVASLKERYGLDRPLPMQYVKYVSRVARGDLGEDFVQRRPVAEIIAPKLVNTGKLALAAIIIEAAIGLVAGFIAAVYRYSFYDVFVTLTTTLAIGVPTFVIGLLMQNMFAIRLQLFPLFGTDGLRSLVLPAVTLAIVDAALVARLMRGSMLEVLRADYVRTATAKGLPRRQVLVKHAARNSIIPVVTYLGIAFGTLLGGAIITEAVFNWDGIGLALVTAIQQQNNPIIIGVVTYGVAIFVVLNLLVDIAYAWLDPRIRLD